MNTTAHGFDRFNSMNRLHTFGGTRTLDGQTGVTHVLLLGLDLAHLGLLDGQTALVVGTVQNAQRQERVAAELERMRLESR